MRTEFSQSIFASNDRGLPFNAEDLQKAQIQLTDQIIVALSSAIEAKDRYTNGHSQRVAEYSMEIAHRLGWDEAKCLRVYYTGLLHDVGKISVPDEILNKTGRLTDEEYTKMQLHTMMGFYILKGISTVSDFAIGARWHHERYDGSGYPNGLTQENIPPIARVISVADAYDSMTSNRSYRAVMPRERVREEMEKGLGTQFDPVMGKIMLEMIDEDAEYQMCQAPMKEKYKVLAIDDDPVEIKLIEFLLKNDPLYDVTSTLTGAEGIELFRRGDFDVILLDAEMPDMSGYQVLDTIRTVDERIPIIFLTGKKDVGNILKAETMGVSDYLTKPVAPPMLYESIRNVLFSHIYGTAAS